MGCVSASVHTEVQKGSISQICFNLQRPKLAEEEGTRVKTRWREQTEFAEKKKGFYTLENWIDAENMREVSKVWCFQRKHWEARQAQPLAPDSTFCLFLYLQRVLLMAQQNNWGHISTNGERERITCDSRLSIRAEMFWGEHFQTFIFCFCSWRMEETKSVNVSPPGH